MAALILEEFDRFKVMYDMLVSVQEGIGKEAAIVKQVSLSAGTVDQMLVFLLMQGYVKTVIMSDSEFKITTLGSNFVKEFEGIRKFLS